MFDPYTPPKTTNTVQPVQANNRVLRWVAVIALGYLAGTILFSNHEQPGYKYFSVILMLALALGGKLRHRFHLGVAIWMGFTISAQALMMNKALQDPEFITVAIPERPWLYFIKSIIPHGVTMIATFLLFLKRTKTTSVEQEPQD